MFRYIFVNNIKIAQVRKISIEIYVDFKNCVNVNEVLSRKDLWTEIAMGLKKSTKIVDIQALCLQQNCRLLTGKRSVVSVEERAFWKQLGLRMMMVCVLKVSSYAILLKKLQILQCKIHYASNLVSKLNAQSLE